MTADTAAGVVLEPLGAGGLDEARAVLAAACPFDDAAAVAEEKLLAPGPQGPATAWLARTTGGAAVGVAASSARWLRLIAVAPDARGRGVGSALLARAEAALREAGASRARALGQPGNYLAPGVDVRNADAIAWLERRGWARGDEEKVDLIVDVQRNPMVSAVRADELATRMGARGYQIRRAGPDEAAGLTSAIAAEFGGAWPWEVERALAGRPPGVHVAIRDDAYAAFAVHDGNNRGLGWFGPAGTWPAHRGQGLGEALLLACLVDVADRRDLCEVAWIGPRGFYERAAGVVGQRRFWPMAKTL
jgi:mycothiol synthase